MKYKPTIIFLTYFILAICNAHANPNTWLELNGIDMPEPYHQGPFDRYDMFNSNSGSDIYSYCGTISYNILPTDFPTDIYRFSMLDSTWTRIGNVPFIGRTNCASFTIGSTSYLVGGKNYELGVYFSDNWAFALPTASWVQKTSFPGQARELSGGFSIGTNGYVVGGRTSTGVQLNEVWLYNSTNDTWTRKSDYPGHLGSWFNMSSINGLVYCLGTYYANSVFANEFYRYDPANDTWTALPTPLIPDFCRGSATYGGLAYFYNNNRQCYCFNPVNQTWVQKNNLPFSTNLNDFISTPSGIYSKYYQSITKYFPASDSWVQIHPNSPNWGPGPESVFFNGKQRFNTKAYDFSSDQWSLDNLFTSCSHMYNIGSNVYAMRSGTLQVYDSLQGIWRSVTGFPAGLQVNVSFYLNNSIYLGAGDQSGTFYQYNLTSGTWISRAPFPGVPRNFSGRFSLNEKGYLVAGTDDSGLSLFDVWQYDPISNSWNRKTDYPGNGYSGSVFTTSRLRGYSGLGLNYAAGTQNPSDIYEYNPLADAWTVVTSFPGGGRNGAGMFEHNGLLHIAGGSNYIVHADQISVPDHWVYFPALTCGPAITASVINQVTCNGASDGRAIVQIISGTAATYQWQPTGGTAAIANNLSAGTYTITVTDTNGCSTSAQVVITQPAALILGTPSITPSVCGNSQGSATINILSGGPATSFVWSPTGGNAATANNLVAGSYSVTITYGNGCTTTTSISIPNINGPVIAVNSNNVSCYGRNDGSATVIIVSGTATTYSWYPAGGNSATASNLYAGSYSITVTDMNGCATTSQVTITEPPPLTLSISSTPTTCGNNDGSATISYAGGGPVTSIVWSPFGGNTATANNLAAGNYTATITYGNGCTSTGSVTISSSNGPVISTSSNNVSCFGLNDGSAAVTIAGGTPTSISWSPFGGNGTTASNLPAGIYTVTVTDALGCTTSAQASILQPNPIILSVLSQSPLCHGESTGFATATYSGGTGFISIFWYPLGGNGAVANNLPAGSYVAVASDQNGCSATSAFQLNDPLLLEATVGFENIDTCIGNSTSIDIPLGGQPTASGGTVPYSYNWLYSNSSIGNAPNITYTASQSGTFAVQVTDANGCQATDSGWVTLNSAPQASIFISGDTLYSATVGLTYHWFDGNLQLQPDTTSYFIPTSNGSYILEVSYGNFCTSRSSVFNYTSMGIYESSFLILPRLSPNPSVSSVKIEWPNQTNWEFNLTSMNGQTILYKHSYTESFILNTDLTPPGIYLARFTRDNKSVYLKMIKTN